MNCAEKGSRTDQCSQLAACFQRPVFAQGDTAEPAGLSSHHARHAPSTNPGRWEQVFSGTVRSFTSIEYHVKTNHIAQHIPSQEAL